MSELGTAHRALEDVRLAKARMAQKAVCPWYKHALFGALFGALVADWAGPMPVVFATEGAVLITVLCMFVFTRRKLGFFVNGLRRGRTRPIAIGLLLAYFPTFGCAAWFKHAHNLAWPALVLGALMFIVGSWASVLWQRAYLRELDPRLGAAS